MAEIKLDKAEFLIPDSWVCRSATFTAKQPPNDVPFLANLTVSFDTIAKNRPLVEYLAHAEEELKAQGFPFLAPAERRPLEIEGADQGMLCDQKIQGPTGTICQKQLVARQGEDLICLTYSDLDGKGRSDSEELFSNVMRSLKLAGGMKKMRDASFVKI